MDIENTCNSDDENSLDYIIPKNLKWFIISCKLLKHKPKTIIENAENIFKRIIFRSTITRIWKVYEETGDIKKKSKTRPNKFSNVQKEAIVEHIKKDP